MMATLYLAREELIASTHAAEAAFKRALSSASKIEDKAVALTADQVRKLEASLKSKTLTMGHARSTASNLPVYL